MAAQITDIMSLGLKAQQAKELKLLSDHFGMKPSQLGRVAIQQLLTQHQAVIAAYEASATKG